MVEAGYTPEVAKGLVGVVARPEATSTLAGTATEQAILESARKQYLAGQSEESLKVISGDVVPYTDKDINRVLLWNLSSKRNATTQDKEDPTNADETKRFQDSKDMTHVARQFLEKGTIDPRLRQPIVDFLTKNSQAVGELMKEMTTGGMDVNAFVDGLMKTPGFRDQLRQLFIEGLDPTKRLSQEGTVKNLELEIAKLSAQLGTEVTQAQIDAARTEVDSAKAALTPHTAELLQRKTKSDRLQGLEDQMADIKKQLRDNQGQGKPMAIELANLTTEKDGLNPLDAANTARLGQIDIRMKEIEKNGKYLNYSSAKAEIDEHTSLITEISTLQVGLEPFEQEIIKKQEVLKELLEKQKLNITPQKKAEIEADIQSKKGLLADAKTALEAEMIKFYREVTHMGQDAMEKHLNGAFGKLKEIWKAEATKQATEDTTKEGKLAALGIDKAYNTLCKKTETKGNLTFFKPDKTKAKNILNEAFKAGGAENIAIYLETATPAGLGITADEHTALKAKLKDPDFRKTQSEGLAKQALADYLIDGGRMNGDLVKSLATTDFGKALLTEARAKVDTAMSQYKDQFGKGVFDNSTRFGEFLKSNKWWLIGPAILALLIALGLMAAR
ncbi:MAG: hypothetical protein ACD_12C00206G0015 [uncultured bacterium]|nr:MAG: hypothetical protein ACD_12C00206G0015 [uncultured bacterium]